MTRFTPQWLQAGSYAASIDRRLIGALWPAAASTGMAVSVSAAMTLNIAAGQCAVPTANNTGSALCSSDAVEQVTLTAAPASGSNRIDLVCVQVRGTDIDGGTDNDFIFSVVAGTVAASPVAPAVPANAVALAQVYVGGGVAAIVAGNITDLRPGRLNITQAAVPRGTLTQVVGPAATATIAAAFTTAFSVTFPVVAGRRYKVTGQCRMQQTTLTNSTSQHQLIDDQSDVQLGGARTASAVGNTTDTVIVLAFVANSTRTATATWQASAGSGGAASVAANGIALLVEDIGT